VQGIQPVLTKNAQALEGDWYMLLRGGHWGVLNTAIPQKNLANTSILREKKKIAKYPNTSIPSGNVVSYQITTLHVKV